MDQTRVRHAEQTGATSGEQTPRFTLADLLKLTAGACIGLGLLFVFAGRDFANHIILLVGANVAVGMSFAMAFWAFGRLLDQPRVPDASDAICGGRENLSSDPIDSAE